VGTAGQRLFVAIREDGGIAVIDLATYQVRETIGVGGFPRALALHADGDTLFVADYARGRLVGIDTETYQVTDEFQVGAGPTDAAISKNGSKIYATNKNENSLSIVNLISESVSTYTVADVPSRLALIPDNEIILVASAGLNKVQIISPGSDLPVFVPKTVSATIPTRTEPATVRPPTEPKEASPAMNRPEQPQDDAKEPAAVAKKTDPLEMPVPEKTSVAEREGTGSFPESPAEDITWAGAESGETAAEASPGERLEVSRLVSPLEREERVTGTKIEGISLSPAVVFILNGNSRDVSVLDVRENRIISRFEMKDRVEGLAVSPEGDYIYLTRHYNDSLLIINVDAGEIWRNIAVGAAPRAVAVHPGGHSVYVANTEDATISVVTMPQAKVTGNIRVGNNPAALAISPGGDRLYSLNQDSGTVSIVDTASGQTISTLSTGSAPGAVAMSPDGATIYVADTVDDKVSAIRVEDGSITESSVGDRPEALAISPDGATLYCVNYFSQTLSKINARTLVTEEEVPLGNGPTAAVLSPDGATVYVANRFDDTISLVNTSTLEIGETITVGDGPQNIIVYAAPGWNTRP
jgi:YVTN family beta-propeller protein